MLQVVFAAAGCAVCVVVAVCAGRVAVAGRAGYYYFFVPLIQQQNVEQTQNSFFPALSF